MAINWTKDQVIALSPDASSTKAGQGLTNKSKWETLGYDELFAWGECKGSGKDPYKVQINLSEPAFKCSCPSHKFPCKHCLGLFLMLISQESSFTEKEQPLWVKEWIESRTKKAEKQSKKVEKQTTEPKKAPDPEKQAARAAEREAKVKAGIQELELWLKDLIRQGLSITQSQKYSFWDTPAARMVDAQAPGLARMLREMATIPASGVAWQDRLLEKLSLLHLVIEGYKNIENLPSANQQDIRSLIGWTQNQEELLNQPGIFDNWLILGQRVESDSLTPTLRSQRIWLKGQQTKQFALILNFVFGNQPIDTSFISGAILPAELVFFPGAFPLRALIKNRQTFISTNEVKLFSNVLEFTSSCADALAKNPWLERFPCAIENLTLLPKEDEWLFCDNLGYELSINKIYNNIWFLLAISGGHPVKVFGEWYKDRIWPLTVWAENQIYFVG